MAKKEMVIGFDLDGTLLDSIPLHINAFLTTGKKFGMHITEQQYLSSGSTTTEAILHCIKPDLDDKTIKDFVAYKDNYINEHLSRMKPFPDTVKTLYELHRKAKIIILSNTPFHDILKFLEIVGINPLFFDLIVGRDLVEHAKPSPDEIFLAQKLEHHKLDYYIGDSTVDVSTGKMAKVKTIAVATGFNTKEELEREKPYKVIDKLSDLLDII